MRTFQRMPTGGFFEAASGRSIPDDPANRHRQEIDQLLAAGEAEVLPAAPVPAPAPSLSAAELQTILAEHGSAAVKGAIAAKLAEKAG